MPIIVAILAVVGGVIWWWVRNNPRDALSVADDAVTIARNAPRKIAFRRQTKEHPVQGVDDPRLAVATIAQAFISLTGFPTQEAQDRLFVTLRKVFRTTHEETEEMDTLARWLMSQCGGTSETISRVGRRLYKIDGDQSWNDLTAVLTGAIDGDLMPNHHDAIEDLKIALHHR